MGEARKNAKRIKKACFAIADKHSKEHDDYGIAVTSLYTNNILKMSSFGTTDETAAAPICLKKPDLRDNLLAVDAGVALSETTGKLPNHISCDRSNLNLDSMGDGTLIAAKTLKQSHRDQKELQVSTDILQRVGAWFLKHAARGEPGFVQPNINGNVISNEGVDELKKILKDGTNLLAILGLVDENEPEETKVNDREEVDAGGDVVTQMGQLALAFAPTRFTS